MKSGGYGKVRVESSGYGWDSCGMDWSVFADMIDGFLDFID